MCLLTCSSRLLTLIHRTYSYATGRYLAEAYQRKREASAVAKREGM